MQRLWVSGYRGYELGTFGDQDPKIKVIKRVLQDYFINLLENNQLDWVITGANLGVEQWVSEVALQLQEQYPVRVAIIIPYADFANRWNETNQTKFATLTQKVDFFAATSNQAYHSPVQLRNYQNFLLRHTDQSLLIYDPEHPGKPKFDYQAIQNYQKEKDYPLKLIDFYDLEDAAEDMQEAMAEDHSWPE